MMLITRSNLSYFTCGGMAPSNNPYGAVRDEITSQSDRGGPVTVGFDAHHIQQPLHQEKSADDKFLEDGTEFESDQDNDLESGYGAFRADLSDEDEATDYMTDPVQRGQGEEEEEEEDSEHEDSIVEDIEMSGDQYDEIDNGRPTVSSFESDDDEDEDEVESDAASTHHLRDAFRPFNLEEQLENYHTWLGNLLTSVRYPILITLSLLTVTD
jgi:hypothetical protein